MSFEKRARGKYTIIDMKTGRSMGVFFNDEGYEIMDIKTLRQLFPKLLPKSIRIIKIDWQSYDDVSVYIRGRMKSQDKYITEEMSNPEPENIRIALQQLPIELNEESVDVLTRAIVVCMNDEVDSLGYYDTVDDRKICEKDFPGIKYFDDYIWKRDLEADINVGWSEPAIDQLEQYFLENTKFGRKQMAVLLAQFYVAPPPSPPAPIFVDSQHIDKSLLIPMIKAITILERIYRFNFKGTRGTLKLGREIKKRFPNEFEPIADWVLARTVDSDFPEHYTNWGCRSYIEYQQMLLKRKVKWKEQVQKSAEEEKIAKEGKRESANKEIFNAIKGGDTSQVEVLISYGADLNAVNEDGKTLGEIADEFNRLDIKNMLDEACTQEPRGRHIEMTIYDQVEKIKEALRKGDYTSESAVSQYAVLPVLEELGWPIRVPGVVIPEHKVEGRRVDFALWPPGKRPAVFVEVKKVGLTEGADQQLFEYAFHEGVPMAILTDGQEWSFYLPGEQGPYHERRVYKVDLLERATDEAIERLSRYLDYDRTCSGEALKAAKSDYKNVARHRDIESTLPKAWTSILEEPDSLLLEMFAEKVEDLCGYKPDLDTCGQYIESYTQGALPAPVAPKGSAPRISKRKRTGAVDQYNFTFKGEQHSASYAIEVLIKVFQLLAEEDSTFLERFAARKHGKKRRYIAQNKLELYPDRPDLAESSAQIVPGWWIGTNYSKSGIRKIINLACEVAGTSVGSTIKISFD